MKGRVKERWVELCEQAAVEQDPAKLLELTQEINRLLTEKQTRLNQTASQDTAQILREAGENR